MNKTCVIIAGPTAVGKTALAIRLAQHFSTEIISADSRQCYKELNIGVAKPSPLELSLVHHYFIKSHPVTENISAADYESYALASIDRIFQQNDMAVMVGGTGLYIKAFTDGLDDIPAILPEIKSTIIENYNNGGIEWLQEQVKKNDPDYYVHGEIFNPQRMMRALEVKLSTGQSIRSFQRKQKKERSFRIIKTGLEMPRPVLYKRINARVDEMINVGLVNEVETLIKYKSLNALQTVGYREVFDYLDNKISLPDAISMIKQNTRHYAKRQMTWFKKDADMHWVDMTDADAAFSSVLSYVSGIKKAGK